jgi:hypothetical protein
MTARRTLRRIIAPAAVLLALATALVVLASTAAGSSTPICSATVCPIKLSYYGPLYADPTKVDESLCKPSLLPSKCFINLRGLLYLPGRTSIAGSKPHLPVVIFVHGSTTGGTAPDATAMAQYFTHHGYAFFAVHRRGHGLSTGVDIDAPQCSGCTVVQDDTKRLANLKRQVFEVRHAIARLLKLKTSAATGSKLVINPNKVALLGHSLGGIITLYANTAHIGQRTIIDIAGASEQWDRFDSEDGTIDGHGPSIEALKQVVSEHVTPPMFVQPTNDCSTVPTDAFSEVVADQNKVYEATLFRNVPNVAPDDCGSAHTKFVFQSSQVIKWGPEAKVWLVRMFGT